MRNEDPDQRLDREVIEGSGASSSRDGAGNEQEVAGKPVAMSAPQPRPAEPSVSVDQSPREKAMMRTWAILRVTGGNPESRLWKKEKQRGSGSTPSVTKKVMNGWRPRKIGCESTVFTDEDCFSTHDYQGGTMLSDISKRRRESTVCSADGWRTEDR